MNLLISFRDDVFANLNGKSPVSGLIGLFYSPSLLAVTLYRISSTLAGKGRIGRLIAIIVWRLNYTLNSADLHWESVIAPGLFLPHPLGVVIGRGARIGRNVTIYQNVTIGIATRQKYQSYPIIEDNVTVYSGAVIVGSVSIGRCCVIGANAVVLRNVPENHSAVGIPAIARNR